MTADYPHFYLARLVLETATPLSIASGRTDGIADTLLMRDANGLPAIPGSSLAGVLRHLYQATAGDDAANTLFGYARSSDKDETEEGFSLLQVSWGVLHNSQDAPQSDLLDPDDDIWQDSLLEDACNTLPVIRDQVRLNHRGAAEDAGKFDRTMLTAGHRFSVELSLWSDDADDHRWRQLLNLLTRTDFRLGGGTRRGLGKLKLVRCYTGQFNLQSIEDLSRFSQLSQNLNDITQLQPHKPEITPQTVGKSWHIQLIPEELWQFGGGRAALNTNREADAIQPTKAMPQTEVRIFWSAAQIGEKKTRELLIPASSVKGTLRHRTVFHYNRLAGKFGDDAEEAPAAINVLFGYVDDQDDTAQRGHLLIDDLYLTPPDTVDVPHNSVDRFTGGVRDGALFFEEMLYGGTIPLTIMLLQSADPLPEHAVEAFELALTDLQEGRLALGAGSGRGGYGYFIAAENQTVQEASHASH